MIALIRSPTASAIASEASPSRRCRQIRVRTSVTRCSITSRIAAAAWGCAVLAVLLVVVARPPLGEGLWFFAVDVAVACVYGTVAALVLSRRPHPVG